MRKGESVESRFWRQVEKTDSCWNWVGYTRNGYGSIRIGGREGKLEYCHRLSLTLYGVTIPYDMTVDHLCRNKRCVNPDHLEVVTHAINSFRSPGIGGRKEVCKRGHLMEGSNLGFRKDSTYYRYCIACSRERARKKGVQLLNASPTQTLHTED